MKYWAGAEIHTRLGTCLTRQIGAHHEWELTEEWTVSDFCQGKIEPESACEITESFMDEVRRQNASWRGSGRDIPED